MGSRGEGWRAVLAKYWMDPEVYNRQLFVFQIAELLCRRGEESAAIDAYREALEYDPNNRQALRGLLTLLQKRGLKEEASPIWARLFATEFDTPGLSAEAQQEAVTFRLAAVQGSTPARAPAGYVTAVYDAYAPRFEDHLRKTLNYQGPELLHELLARSGLPAGMLCDVLDIGCGTGLVGTLFRPWARRLDGVDLSPEMLAHARQGGLYDRLDLGELTETMQARPETYDLILAADVLVYFGDLEPVLGTARVALRPGGWFAFLVESGPGPGFTLNVTGRYVHGREYLHLAAAASGLEVAGCEEGAIRLQSGQPVAGLVMLLRKAPNSQPISSLRAHR